MIPKLAPLTWWCPPPPENSEPARRFGQTHTGKRLLFEGSPCRQSSRHRPMLRTPLRRLFLFCRGAGASKHGCRHSQPACGTSAPLPAPAPVPASLGPLPAAPRPSPRGLPARRVRCAQPDSRTRSRPEVSSPTLAASRRFSDVLVASRRLSGLGLRSGSCASPSALRGCPDRPERTVKVRVTAREPE